MKYTIYGDQTYRNEMISLLSKHHHIFDDDNPDYIFSFGGDGTILRAIHQYIERIESIYFIGINLGKLGFYTDFEAKERVSLIDLIENKEYKIDSYPLLEYVLQNQDECKCGYGLNEVAIINPLHTQIIDVYIDDRHFETFRGTGFLASTPTGSTAYSKSLGGSVIDPHIKSLQLTEIASINNRVYKTLSSPLVLSQNTTVTLKSDFSNAYVTVDGLYDEFKSIHDIKIKLSTKQVHFLIKDKTDFWDRVKKSFLE